MPKPVALALRLQIILVDRTPTTSESRLLTNFTTGLNRSISLFSETPMGIITSSTEAGGIVILVNSTKTLQYLYPSKMVPPFGRSRLKITSKVRSCLFETISTTSCGPKETGPALTTASRMQLATHPLVHLNESEKFCSRIRRSVVEQDTIP